MRAYKHHNASRDELEVHIHNTAFTAEEETSNINLLEEAIKTAYNQGITVGYRESAGVVDHHLEELRQKG
jgi:hypothetical protein